MKTLSTAFQQLGAIADSEGKGRFNVLLWTSIIEQSLNLPTKPQ